MNTSNPEHRESPGAGRGRRDLVRTEEKSAQLAALNSRLNIEVAERKRVETALRENEKLLQTIIDSEPECVKMLAADGSLLMMNKAGLAMIEAESLDQVKDQCVYPLVLPEYRARPSSASPAMCFRARPAFSSSR
jgi:PAS domain-containing protein